MKSKEPVSVKRQSVTVKDLKTRKNPKGGACGPIPGSGPFVRKSGRA